MKQDLTPQALDGITTLGSTITLQKFLYLSSAVGLKTSKREFDDMFTEIKTNKPSHIEPTFVEAYVIRIKPEYCGKLVQWLANELPLSGKRCVPQTQQSAITDTVQTPNFCDLTHLKRVRSTKLTSFIHDEVLETQSSHSDVKKESGNVICEVLLAPVAWLDELEDHEIEDNAMNPVTRLKALLSKINTAINIDCVHKNKRKRSLDDSRSRCTTNISETIALNQDDVLKATIAARLAINDTEYIKCNLKWPTNLFKGKYEEFETPALTDTEQTEMIMGMKAAIQDAIALYPMNYRGAVVVDPLTSKVVSKASDELAVQSNLSGVLSKCPQHRNVLSSSILLACQGVSRIEREMAQKHGLHTDAFRNGQYLCTGFDVYTTVEPSVFEAMALVHYRVNRVVFGCGAAELDGNEVTTRPHVSGIVDKKIHCLPGANHRYRAFSCESKSELWDACYQMYKA